MTEQSGVLRAIALAVILLCAAAGVFALIAGRTGPAVAAIASAVAGIALLLFLSAHPKD
ncbi:hypothetical protein KDN32_12245 [Nocardioides sp. J2M5]|uniref:hypothetical protein n=1 Tax=Nocardioides palaemonis TaxID=2829810 RepID=UPI001BA68A5A|nr:hypothetical protein [Nocardioides palaemonis]MBS2938513.1 hypothetical protein [Nocardioides palaemonis]